MNNRKKPAPPQVFPVTEETTLLPFLLAHVAGKSRNNVKSMLARGQVSVDEVGVTRFDHPLAPGQQVKVAAAGRIKRDLPFPLLFEDEYILAVCKPAGLLSMANEHEKEHTAYRLVMAYMKAGDPDSRIFIVHRLDRNTSGVIVFAKSEEVRLTLQNNWDTMVKRRGYRAVVEGIPKPSEGTVRSHLKETLTHKVYSVKSGGKEAITHYKTIRSGNNHALLEVTIDTGRKNQIRVHMADLGCPVVGDDKYGAATNPLKRLALHAHELQLTHPVTGEILVLRADTPKDFARLVKEREVEK